LSSHHGSQPTPDSSTISFNDGNRSSTPAAMIIVNVLTTSIMKLMTLPSGVMPCQSDP